MLRNFSFQKTGQKNFQDFSKIMVLIKDLNVNRFLKSVLTVEQIIDSFKKVGSTGSVRFV